MIERNSMIFIRDKLKLIWLISFILVMLLIGIIINNFERYCCFGTLASLLLLMMASTIWVLKIVLKNISNFKANYEKEEMFQQSFAVLFHSENRAAINFSFALMIFIYFICLYQLHFLTLNIMGCYMLFLGGGTFLFALVAYELHIRLTICLYHLEKYCSNGELNYCIYNPKDTPWLLNLYKLSKLLQMSSFIIGLLFVSENALFFVVNINKFFNEPSQQHLPLEFYIIWIFIFVTITLALPAIALMQINSLRNIVLLIEKNFKLLIMKNYEDESPYKNISHLFVLLQTTQLVEKSLSETYLPKKGEKIIAISSSLLTCFIHILSFFDFIFP